MKPLSDKLFRYDFNQSSLIISLISHAEEKGRIVEFHQSLLYYSRCKHYFHVKFPYAFDISQMWYVLARVTNIL